MRCPSEHLVRKEAIAPALREVIVAPELLTAECANILWKKCQRDELSKDEAFLAAQLFQAADIEFLPTRLLLEAGDPDRGRNRSSGLRLPLSRTGLGTRLSVCHRR